MGGGERERERERVVGGGGGCRHAGRPAKWRVRSHGMLHESAHVKLILGAS